MKQASPYEILRVQRTATDAEIRKAWRTFVLEHHPDKHGGSAESTEQFKRVSAAYQALSHESRAETDRQLALHEERTAPAPEPRVRRRGRSRRSSPAQISRQMAQEAARLAADGRHWTAAGLGFVAVLHEVARKLARPPR